MQDLPGRIHSFKQRGYELVNDVDGEEQSKGVGSDVRRSAGKSDLILMRIPIEFYEDDQRHKGREVGEIEKQIKEGNLKGQDQKAAYIPSGHTNTIS